MLINSFIFKQSENETSISFTNSILDGLNIMMKGNKLSEQENKTKKRLTKRFWILGLKKFLKKQKNFYFNIMKKYAVVEIKGGLGNQIFQYSFGCHLEKRGGRARVSTSLLEARQYLSLQRYRWLRQLLFWRPWFVD